MKKYFVSVAMASLLVACGGNTANDNNNGTNEGTANNSTAEAPSATADITQNPDYQKGLDLIGASDCLTCHQPTTKVVGPAYQDVADRYAGQDTAVTYLAHRVIHGVNPATDKANWADVTNNAIMTPHPQLSEADAEQMVKYILLLKTK